MCVCVGVVGCVCVVGGVCVVGCLYMCVCVCVVGCVYVYGRVCVVGCIHMHISQRRAVVCGEYQGITSRMRHLGGGWEYQGITLRQILWGLTLTISGLQTVGETQGQVAFRQELSCFLSKADHHLGKVFRLF